MPSPGTVVIAGAAGFLGGYVSTTFAEAGWTTVGVDRVAPAPRVHPARPVFEEWIQNDLDSVEEIAALLRRTRPAAWIHLAGPASVLASFEEPVRDLSAATLPLARVLEAVRRANATTRVLLASSAAVYGEPESLPVGEDAALRPISPYGFHKLHQELLLDEYHLLHRLRVCKARIFSTYGPGTMQLAVWEIARRAMEGDLTIFGSGAESRDYLYVGDVAEALRCICERSAFTSEAVNVASGEETRISELTKAIYAALGVAGDPVFGHDARRGNPQLWRADVTRLRQLSFSPKVGLEEGVKRTVSWIRAHA